MGAKSVYIGIDVACAFGKRLPICVVSADSLVPLEIDKQLLDLIPRGAGNREVASNAPFESSARGVAAAIKRITQECRFKVERIGIDAPAAPSATGARSSEVELARAGLSCFRTPAVSEWDGIRVKCVGHLKTGRSVATIPHANKIWMLFGFELFAKLKSSLEVEVIEVYPFAIAHALLGRCEHKSTEQGYQDQLRAVAKRTGWTPRQLDRRLKETVSGRRDDRLDAFMAAWVASLPSSQRRVFGDAANSEDSIWVPR